MMNLTSTVGNTTVHPKKLKSFFDRIIHKQNHDANSSFYGPTLSLELEKKFINANDIEIPIKNIEKTKLPLYSVPNYNQNVIEPVLSKNHRQSSPITNNSIGTDKEKKTKKIEKYEIDTYNLEKQEIETFGPVLPPHMEKHRVIESVLLENIISSDNKVIDTPLRSNIEDDETFGPLPVDHPAIRKSYIQIQLEQRAKQVKAKIKDKISSEKRKREEWMVELPPTHAIALSFESRSRKFKMNEGSDLSDRSMWTDTPVDKYFKQTEKKEPLFVKSEESNNKLNKCKYEDVIKESVKQVKCESLLDMHLKSLKRKKKKLEKEAKEFGLSTRRPFDRDIDLQMNRLNDARKKNIFEKASCFNERFTPGKI
ncbi:PREDICTED: GPALPP motifs-containing protein 1 [Ceratosolen solmsi marchali]|uniref:GPALPP motifs-containing protein 1 n=1 Tax=Ceratosolen solmsi marchali TaxID=326594 RepID=A0AAJ6YF95_9HYME|nr:PREDICTED: GPALPP motifs-containing protein 1 [Ceratosolen solmsi marchali]